MPIVIHCWKGVFALPPGHGDIVVAASAFPDHPRWLWTRDEAVSALNLALVVIGPDCDVEVLRDAIAEDEECAMVTVEERTSLPTSGVPRLRSRHARQR